MRALAVVMLVAGSASAEPILAANASYACARVQGGHVACWGQTPGESHPLPVVVPGLADIAGVAAAPSRLFAWSTKGDAWQWNGTLAALPVHDVVEIAGGDDAACVRQKSGAVVCWVGANPPAPAISGGATQLAVAGRQACARIGNDVTCWTLGGAHTEIVPEAHGAIAIAGADRGTRGAAFVAVLPAKLAGWTSGWDADGTHAGARKPLAVPALADTTAIAIGDTDACAVGKKTITCWADDRTPVPRRIDVAGAIAIAVGGSASCAAMPDRSVKCWGDQSAIGTGVPAFSTTPTDVDGITDAVELAASGESACVRRANGHVACWGARLTDDWNARSRAVDLAPREVPGVTDAKALFVAISHACVRRANGHVACWGFNGKVTRHTAVDVPAYAHATWLGMGDREVCALVGRRLECGGRVVDRFHHVPDGTTEIWMGSWYRGEYLCARAHGTVTCQEDWSAHGENDLDDVTFEGLDDAVAIAMPENQEIDQLCAAQPSGDVACMAMTDRTMKLVPGVTGVRAFGTGPISVGTAARCAVTGQHTVACWADPAAVWTVPGITDAVEVAGGDGFGCVRHATGTVSCWGFPDYVGGGGATRATRDTAVAVPDVAL